MVNADDTFRPNEAVSLRVNSTSAEETTRLFAALEPGSIVRMDLGEYPLSPMYAWVEDKNGVTWQLMTGDHAEMVPCMMLSEAAQGKARRAVPATSRSR
nr:VOC family protein [uncultured Corynebacterium sp.]